MFSREADVYWKRRKSAAPATLAASAILVALAIIAVAIWLRPSNVPGQHAAPAAAVVTHAPPHAPPLAPDVCKAQCRPTKEVQCNEVCKQAEWETPRCVTRRVRPEAQAVPLRRCSHPLAPQPHCTQRVPVWLPKFPRACVCGSLQRRVMRAV